MRRLLIVFMSLIMVFAMAVPAFAYSDTANCSDAQKDAINNLSKLEIIQGYDDGTFRPNAGITRAEFAKIAISTYIEYTGNVNFMEVYYDFIDLKDGAWYTDWIQKACNAKLLVGYEDNTFRPNNNITANEAVTVMMRIMGFDGDSLGGTWPDNYWQKAKEEGILENIDVDGNKVISRADVCVLANNVLNYTAAEAKYAIVEKIDGENVTLMDLDGKHNTYTVKDTKNIQINDLITYTVNSQNIAELSAADIYKNNTATAAVDDTKVKLNGKSYNLTDSTKVYLIDGANGKLTSATVNVSVLKKQTFIQAAHTSKIDLDIQYNLNGENVDYLIIGGYYGGSSLNFGFIKEIYLRSSETDKSVELFGHANTYDVSSKSDEEISKNVLYQYSIKNNIITLNKVDVDKEQIKNGEIFSFGDDLYNVKYADGSDSQFIVTKDTVVMKVVYKANGNIESVDYDYQIKKGDIVNVRYNVKAEDKQEAAYVMVIKQK